MVFDFAKVDRESGGFVTLVYLLAIVVRMGECAIELLLCDVQGKVTRLTSVAWNWLNKLRANSVTCLKLPPQTQNNIWYRICYTYLDSEMNMRFKNNLEFRRAWMYARKEERSM